MFLSRLLSSDPLQSRLSRLRALMLQKNKCYSNSAILSIRFSFKPLTDRFFRVFYVDDSKVFVIRENTGIFSGAIK